MAGTLRQARAAAWLARMDQAEVRLCRRFNAAVQRAGTRRVFQIASRLGDGIVWYLLIAALPLGLGRAGLATALQMALAGLGGLLLYRLLKRRFVRERPFITHASIIRAGEPLDRFSFPSGHTLHAVSFTIIAVAAWPLLALLLIPLALLIALSRVVLGLHYPSDVLVGAVLGAGVAAAVLSWPLL
ncbi:MAG: phosphatase PAP2 family protein [Pseudomonadota bacterium]